MTTVASLFNQLLQHFPRTEFGALVKKHNAERGGLDLKTWILNAQSVWFQRGGITTLSYFGQQLNFAYKSFPPVPSDVYRLPAPSEQRGAGNRRPAWARCELRGTKRMLEATELPELIGSFPY